MSLSSIADRVIILPLENFSQSYNWFSFVSCFSQISLQLSCNRLPICSLIYVGILFRTQQESVYERMKKAGGANPFNLFVLAEMECMHRLLAAVRETLLVN